MGHTMMSAARRAFGLLWALSIAGIALAQTDELFPKPPELVDAVKFWTRVYTEIDTHSGFIHDDLRLDVVYQTVRIPEDMSVRDRRRRVERAVETTRNALSKLATGARTGLSDEEERILKLFPEGTSNGEFRAAIDRIRFQLGQSDRFRAGLVRSGTYKSYIYEILDKEGLPRQLAALPHVESSFDPTAYSKVGAAGMWQFTRSTGMRYLQIDRTVDERRDPFFATAAAARLLADNHDVLGTWPLALTAYNHGLAGMRRAMIQQNTTDIGVIVRKYQSRSFGFASRNFYAAFLAALDVDTRPAEFFGDVKINPPSDTAVVSVPDYVDADRLASALNLRQSTLRELNPALTDAVWSGQKFVPKGFQLRVPRSTAAVAHELLAAIDANERYAGQRADKQHKVRAGDTLSAIAAEYHVSLAALMRVNGLSGRDMIHVGQMIALPTEARGEPAVAAAAVLVRNESAVRPPAAPAVASSALGVYTVRSGDSIEKIAKKLGVDGQALVAANSIKNRNLLAVGQQLKVPGSQEKPADTLFAADTAPVTEITAALATASPSAAAAVDASTPAAASALDDDGAGIEAEELAAALAPATLANGQPAPAEGSIVNALATEQDELAADPSDYSVSNDSHIVVQALETLGHYADWLEVPTQRLRELNKLGFRDSVVIGQTLALDFSQVDAMTFEQRRVAYQQQRQSEFFAAYQISDIESHVIKSGESLWVLAERKYKVPVWLLRQYNPDVNLDRLMPGAVVKFPRLRAIGGQNAATPVAALQTVAGASAASN
jgi:membrane-bound lytic murein transglycosylase D